MQAPAATPAASAVDRPPDGHVVRPAGVLADLLGAAELGEDELLLRLRQLGLITYRSPLLWELLEKLPEVLEAEVLAQLDPTDVVLFGQANRACRAAVVAFGVQQADGRESLDGGEEEEEEEEEEGEKEDDEVEVEKEDEEEDPQDDKSLDAAEQEDEEVEVESLEEGSTNDEGTEGGPLLLKFRVNDFVRSVERLAWAKDMGCPWDTRICEYAAQGGHLEVLKWAWERRCPWDSRVCSYAAESGHLDVLRWAREHGCDWDDQTCMYAAWGGHLEVLSWAHEHGCSWRASTCSRAAAGGHLRVL